MYLITDESCRLDKVTCITEVRIANMHACLKLYIYTHLNLLLCTCTHTCIYRIGTVYCVLYIKNFQVRIYHACIYMCVHVLYTHIKINFTHTNRHIEIMPE